MLQVFTTIYDIQPRLSPLINTRPKIQQKTTTIQNVLPRDKQYIINWFNRGKYFNKQMILK